MFCSLLTGLKLGYLWERLGSSITAPIVPSNIDSHSFIAQTIKKNPHHNKHESINWIKILGMLMITGKLEAQAHRYDPFSPKFFLLVMIYFISCY